MKKIISGVFAFAMMFGLVFLGDAISSNGTLSVSAMNALSSIIGGTNLGVIDFGAIA